MFDHLGIRDRQFLFDEVFDERQSNMDVFEMALKPLIKSLKQGFNATCFAYGMTGAGKTHTMFGNQILKKSQVIRYEPGIANLAI